MILGVHLVVEAVATRGALVVVPVTAKAGAAANAFLQGPRHRDVLSLDRNQDPFHLTPVRYQKGDLCQGGYLSCLYSFPCFAYFGRHSFSLSGVLIRRLVSNLQVVKLFCQAIFSP